MISQFITPLISLPLLLFSFYILLLKNYLFFLSFSGANHRSAQVLLLLVIPGHLIFLYTIDLMERGHTSLTPVFTVVYLAAALFQVSVTKIGPSNRASRHRHLHMKVYRLCSAVISMLFRESVITMYFY